MFLQGRAQRTCAIFVLLIAVSALPAQADKSGKATDKKTESSDKKKEEKLSR